MDDYEAYNLLIYKLNAVSQDYYKTGKSKLTDAEYDNLCLEAKAYERKLGIIDEKSPTTHIQYDVDEEDIISHGNHRMLSLDNITTNEEIEDFINTIPDGASLVVEPKFDGMAASVCIDSNTYKIKYVITRGDGREGKIITDNFITTVKGFDPTRYKAVDSTKDFFIRGEILLEKNEFLRLKSEGLSDFSNPRNGVAGICNRDNMVELEGISTLFMPYDSINVIKDDEPWNGFILPYKEKLKPMTVKAVIAEVGRVHDNRNKYSFDIDGAVIKVVEKDIREQLGEGNKYPKWGKAYKFRDVEYLTRLHRIEYSVGRSGNVTPVARVEQIDMGGILVSAATLHNRSILQNMKLRIGDTLVMVRSRDVIPKVLRSNHDGNGDIIDFITECPVCGTELAIGDVQAECPNVHCPEKEIKRIVLFCSKSGLNIMGIGESSIRQLYENNIIKNIFSIKNLTDKSINVVISQLSGWNTLSANNLSKEIHNKLLMKGVKDYILLGSLSIPQLLKATAEKLMSKLNLQELIKELNEIKKTKDRTRFYKAFGKKEVLLDNLLENLQYITDVYKVYGNKHICKLIETKGVSQGLSNKGSVCITGVYSIPRLALQELVFAKGYDIDNSVKKNTKYLLAPSGFTSTKVTKAKKNGIKILHRLEDLV